MDKRVILYKTSDNREPVIDWLLSLKDRTTRERIQARIRRIEQGNFGDHKRFSGIIEIRFHFGKGYRLYCGEDGNIIVVLLFGGDKSSQSKGIEKALGYWREYHEQKKI
ncbi:MAG: type II toxin-antitoxin system RelE/ParE family toxin [Elusimicrobiota bacterium]